MNHKGADGLHGDSDLKRRLLGRDPRAADELVDRYVSDVHWLVSLIMGRCGSPEDAEEASADALVRAWERIAEFDPNRTSLRNWVLMMAKYTALDRRRALMRRRFTAGGDLAVISLDQSPEPSVPDMALDESLQREQEVRLHQALAALPENDRDLLVRRYFLEEPIAEIAQSLGLSRSAIDNRLWRARQALRSLLEGGDACEGL